MGDRGGTATSVLVVEIEHNYTRWEIGGEPQLIPQEDLPHEIIPDGRSGGNRNIRLRVPHLLALYPMGDRGGTATTPTSAMNASPLYPMGDRGGTATPPS